MKKLGLILVVVLTLLACPAIARVRLIEGLNIVRECGWDVVRLCKGVVPGEGRVKACIKENMNQLSPSCIKAFMVAVADGGKAEIQLKPGATPGLEVHNANARDYAYCEIAPVIRMGSDVAAQFYNTTGTTGPSGGCPPDKFGAIDEKQLASKLGTGLVYMNPTPQSARRHWVMDQLWVYVAGETVDFDGVAATWMAQMAPRELLSAMGGDFVPVKIHRKSKYLYSKGSTVFLMRAPDSKTYVMQSYATEVDKALSFDQLSQLSAKLKLPAGWKFEAKTLDQDLTIDPRKANGVAHIIRDDLHDVYEGCGFDAACNYVP